MASLPQVKFHEKAKNGDEREVVSKVSVTNDGEFHMTVPDDLETSIRAHITPHSDTYMSRSQRPHMTLRVSGDSLNDCKAAIDAGLRDWMACEISEELVIRYGHRIKTTYWKMPDGTIYANGYDARNDQNYDHERDRAPENGTWHGTLDATTHAPGYSVELVADIAKRITYTRESGSKVVYEGPDFDNFSYTTYGERLNNFVGLRTSDGGYFHDAIDLTDLPYSEKTAKFFYDMLIGMCAFSDKIEIFFAEPETVIEAIESGAVPLIGKD